MTNERAQSRIARASALTLEGMGAQARDEEMWTRGTPMRATNGRAGREMRKHYVDRARVNNALH